MRKKLIKLLIGVLVIAGFIIVLPWGVYWYSLSLVEGRPVPENAQMTSAELKRVWVENEDGLSAENLDKITPYWFYNFLVCGYELKQCTIEEIKGNSSNMASFVAIWYLRDGHFKGRGMGAWHFSGKCLSIWLQRNWSPEQLAASYIEWKDYVTSRDTERKRRTKP